MSAISLRRVLPEHMPDNLQLTPTLSSPRWRAIGVSDTRSELMAEPKEVSEPGVSVPLVGSSEGYA